MGWDLIIGLALFALVPLLIVRRIYKNKKDKGSTLSCACNCRDCSAKKGSECKTIELEEK